MSLSIASSILWLLKNISLSDDSVSTDLDSPVLDYIIIVFINQSAARTQGIILDR